MNSAWVANIVSIFLLSAVFASCVEDNVCGDDMEEKDGMCIFSEDTATEDLLSLVLQIPENFDGDPVLLTVNYFDNPNLEGLPSGFGEKLTSPEIEPGGILELIASQAQLEGAFYMSITLYCEGGGNGMGPVQGIDWVSATPIPITLGPGTGMVDVGDVPLVLME